MVFYDFNKPRFKKIMCHGLYLSRPNCDKTVLRLLAPKKRNYKEH